MNHQIETPLRSTFRRRICLVLSLIVGALALAGTIWFAIAGAGFYGSPLTAGEPYSNWMLVLVLLCGPALILPCVLLELWRPNWGGFVLTILALCELGMIILYNVRQWGFAIHDAGLGAACLALPMFILGSLLLFTSPIRHRMLITVWFCEFIAGATIGAYLTWQVGRDGLDSLIALLSGGTI